MGYKKFMRTLEEASEATGGWSDNNRIVVLDGPYYGAWSKLRRNQTHSASWSTYITWPDDRLARRFCGNYHSDEVALLRIAERVPSWLDGALLEEPRREQTVMDAAALLCSFDRHCDRVYFARMFWKTWSIYKSMPPWFRRIHGAKKELSKTWFLSRLKLKSMRITKRVGMDWLSRHCWQLSHRRTRELCDAAANATGNEGLEMLIADTVAAIGRDFRHPEEAFNEAWDAGRYRWLINRAEAWHNGFIGDQLTYELPRQSKASAAFHARSPSFDDMPEVTPIRTPEEFDRESRKMHHCIRTYADGKTWCYHIENAEGKSTIEMSKYGACRQHKGKCNGSPPASHLKIAKAMAESDQFDTPMSNPMEWRDAGRTLLRENWARQMADLNDNLIRAYVDRYAKMLIDAERAQPVRGEAQEDIPDGDYGRILFNGAGEDP